MALSLVQLRAAPPDPSDSGPVCGDTPVVSFRRQGCPEASGRSLLDQCGKEAHQTLHSRTSEDIRNNSCNEQRHHRRAANVANANSKRALQISVGRTSRQTEIEK